MQIKNRKQLLIGGIAAPTSLALGCGPHPPKPLLLGWNKSNLASNFFGDLPIRVVMDEEITETTIVAETRQKAPSFWANMVTLALLVGAIFWAQKFIERWQPKTLLTEEIEQGIVLEDLETEKPLVEAEEVEVPSAKEKPKPQNPNLKINPKSEIQNAIKLFPYAKPDPYTDGGPLDLDRLENRPKQTLIKEKVPAAKREATATPPLPSERDQYIPFESE